MPIYHASYGILHVASQSISNSSASSGLKIAYISFHFPNFDCMHESQALLFETRVDELHRCRVYDKTQGVSRSNQSINKEVWPITEWRTDLVKSHDSFTPMKAIAELYAHEDHNRIIEHYGTFITAKRKDRRKAKEKTRDSTVHRPVYASHTIDQRITYCLAEKIVRARIRITRLMNKPARHSAQGTHRTFNRRTPKLQSNMRNPNKWETKEKNGKTKSRASCKMYIEDSSGRCRKAKLKANEQTRQHYEQTLSFW